MYMCRPLFLVDAIKQILGLTKKDWANVVTLGADGYKDGVQYR